MINNLFIFLLGLISLSLGVVLVVKSDLGVSVATSVPYVFSLYFTKISFGQWNYIMHGFSLVLLVIVVRKLTVKYSKFKTGFDLVCFTISLIASMILFRKNTWT